MKCKSCGVKYKRWSHEDFDSHLCIKCNEAKWKESEASNEEANEQIRNWWPHECGDKAEREALR